MFSVSRTGMHRKFIALVLGVSVAITGFSAAPARANDDVAKVLLGLAAIAAIGVAVDKHNDRKRDRHHVTRQHRPQHNVHRPQHRKPVVIEPGYHRHGHGNAHRHRGGASHHRHDHAVKPRRLPDNVAVYDLPGQCKRALPGAETNVFLGQRCLQKNYRHVSNLPGQCWITVDNGYKRRSGYEVSCLRRKGYRVVGY